MPLIIFLRKSEELVDSSSWIYGFVIMNKFKTLKRLNSVSWIRKILSIIKLSKTNFSEFEEMSQFSNINKENF